jgi:UTP--glucose-1-phosphate uridylyltransferase
MPLHNKLTKAVIPAAGFGTRMLPATKALPKEMLPVAAKPMIQYAVEEAIASGIETIVVVIRSRKSILQAHFRRDRELESFLEGRRQVSAAELLRQFAKLAELRYVEQKKPLGLADAISCARSVMQGEPFVVLLPDVIIDSVQPATEQLIRAHKRHGGSIIAIREIEPQEVERFGVVGFEDAKTLPKHGSVRLTTLAEKPSPADAPSRFGIFGRYLLEDDIWDAIAKIGCGLRGEVQLTDALNLLCRKKLVHGLLFEGRHFDAGNPLGYLMANIELSLRDPRLALPLREYLSGLQSCSEPRHSPKLTSDDRSQSDRTQQTGLGEASADRSH